MDGLHWLTHVYILVVGIISTTTPFLLVLVFVVLCVPHCCFYGWHSDRQHWHATEGSEVSSFITFEFVNYIQLLCKSNTKSPFASPMFP